MKICRANSQAPIFRKGTDTRQIPTIRTFNFSKIVIRAHELNYDVFSGWNSNKGEYENPHLAIRNESVSISSKGNIVSSEFSISKALNGKKVESILGNEGIFEHGLNVNQLDEFLSDSENIVRLKNAGFTLRIGDKYDKETMKMAITGRLVNFSTENFHSLYGDTEKHKAAMILIDSLFKGDSGFWNRNKPQFDAQGIRFNLDGIFYDDIDFQRLNLERVSFRGIGQIKGEYNANFYGSNLDLADFTGSNLAYAVMHNASIRHAIFRNTLLHGATFGEVAGIESADWTDSVFRGLTLNDLKEIFGYNKSEDSLEITQDEFYRIFEHFYITPPKPFIPFRADAEAFIRNLRRPKHTIMQLLTLFRECSQLTRPGDMSPIILDETTGFNLNALL